MRSIPAGQLLTFEVSWDPVTYVYVDGVGTVRAGKVIFKLSGKDLMCAARDSLNGRRTARAG